MHALNQHLDYIVSKIPRWPFDKFESANRKLGTQMKATGEVMAIGRTFEESLLKAIRSLRNWRSSFELKSVKELIKEIDENVFQNLMMNEYSSSQKLTSRVTIEEIHECSEIDLFFFKKLKILLNLKQIFKANRFNYELLQKQKKWALLIITIAKLWNTNEK